MRQREKILILGADGFLGSNLTRSLLEDKKYHLRAFDLFRNGQSRNLENIRNKIEIFSGDFLNRDDIGKALNGVDYVFHYISLTTPGSSINDPLIDVETNIKGSIVLFEECVKNKVKRVIFSSSGGAIYGNQNKKRFSEDDATNPISPYAISKLTIEKYLEYYRNHLGLDYLILRYSNPYGPGQNIVGSQGIITIFLNLVKNNKPVTIFGDGKNTRDFIYVSDVINITKIIFNKKTERRIYNIGSGTGTTINEIIDMIKKTTNKKVKILKFPKRNMDVRKVILNTKCIQKEFDFKPKISLEDGIKKTWKWIDEL